MIQAFTPELCAHLSSLAPGFEGHWYYIEEDAYVGDGKYGKKVRIVCLGKDEELKLHQQVICPAWQVEDVLRNLKKVFEKRFGKGDVSYLDFVLTISEELAWRPDTAYQKIEEYLWRVLSFDNDSQNAIDAFAYMLQAIKKAKNVLK